MSTINASRVSLTHVLLLGGALMAPALVSCQGNPSPSGKVSGSPQTEAVSQNAAALGPPVVLPTYTMATLPTPGNNGSLARVTDGTRGIWVDNGTTWAPLNGRQVDPMDFGAVGYAFDPAVPNGPPSPIDSCPAIQAALDSLGEAGGTVLFPAGLTFHCSTGLNLDSRLNIHLVGSGTPSGGNFYNLIYRGAGTEFISIKSSSGTHFENLKIAHIPASSSSPVFTGVLINADHAANNSSDTAYLVMDSCTLAGVGTAKALLRLQNTIISTVKNSHFINAKVGILGYDDGTGAYSVAIQIQNTTFNLLETAAIRNADEAWSVTGCTFEPNANGEGIAYNHDPNILRWSRGLSFRDNWFGDASVSSTWVKVIGLGFSFTGNRVSFAGPNGTAVQLDQGTEGAMIEGNQIETGAGKGIAIEPYGGGQGHFNFGNVYGVTITGNKICSAIPIDGFERITDAAIMGNETANCSGMSYTYLTRGLTVGTIDPSTPGVLSFGRFDPNDSVWSGTYRGMIGSNVGSNPTQGDIAVMSPPAYPYVGFSVFTASPTTRQMRVNYQGVQIANGTYIKSHSVGQVTWPSTALTIPAGGLQFVTISVPTADAGYSVAMGYTQVLPDGVILSGQVTSASSFDPATGQAVSPGTVRATIANLSGSSQTINTGGVLSATVWGH